METYIKYNNLDFEKFNLDKILDAIEDCRGFILASVFQKKFSLDVNLKRHEDMKNWLRNQGLSYLVLDGIQKVVDKQESKVYDYSILYILIFVREEMPEDFDFEYLAQLILKRYDLNQIILKNPKSRDLESWNGEMVKKVFRNITSNNFSDLIQNFFEGINRKKDKFYFMGIEKPSSSQQRQGYFRTGILRTAQWKSRENNKVF